VPPESQPEQEDDADDEDVAAARIAAAGVRAVVVHGPPASGKSTYVMQKKGPRDVVFDFDRVMQALSGGELYEDRKDLVGYVLDVRDLVVNRAKKTPGIETTWVIVTKVDERFRAAMQPLSPAYVGMSASREECLSRLEKDKTRSEAAKQRARQVIDRFFADEQVTANVA
jgi:hypothetical protein